MKNYLVLFLFFLITTFGYASDYSAVQQKDTTHYAIVDELPVFPGGDSVLASFIATRFIYPAAALERNLVGVSESVSFMITDSGEVKNIKVLMGATDIAELDREILRVLKLMPRWKPGMLNGKAVNVDYFMAFLITFNPETKTSRIQVMDLSKNNNYDTRAEQAYNNGVQKSQIGDMYGAIADFTEALKYNPKDIDALYNRGILRFKTGDKAGACTDWNAIKNLGKTDADNLIKQYCGN